VTVASAGSAVAEPRLAADRADLRRQLVDLQRRAFEIGQEIRRVEAQIEQDRRVQADPRFAAAECMVPFYLDSMGIRHLRPECVDAMSESSCDPPFALDGRGVRHFREACASSAAEPSADPDE
jgi:hypothetical protein